MHPDLVTNYHGFSRQFPNFGKPNIIGYIGLENLKFARLCHNGKVTYDLDLHIDKAKHKPDDLDVKLNDLLKFLLQNKIRLNFCFTNTLNDSRFFCYRGLLTCLACTPYENNEPWKIVAILHKGNIYLCARDTEEKLRRKHSMTEKEKKCTSWGFKFEQFLLSDSPSSEPDPNKPVDETEEFSLVFTTHLNKHRLVYGAEMDGIRCDRSQVEPPPTDEQGTEAIINYLATKEYIELKTNRLIEYPKQETSFRRFKTKKWWCQSFFAGIDTILCGYRNDDGIVEELKVFNLKDLPRMSQQFWNPSVCLNFIDKFLTYVKECLGREIGKRYGDKALDNLSKVPLVSLMFEWRPRMPVRVQDDYVHEDDPILTDWFLNNFSTFET